MLLWSDSNMHTYGLQEEGTVMNGSAADADPKGEEFEFSDTLEIEATGATTPVSVNGRSVTAIRFLPDGSADETSPVSVRLAAHTGETLWLIQATNRLSYEISDTDITTLYR
jgi:hypothetical protein